MLNFAYGSNLLAERLHARVPGARFVCSGSVSGWRFVMNIGSTDGSAKANALQTGRPEDRLQGALYELDPAGKAVLDRHEDVGGAYRIEHVTAETDTGPRKVYLYAGNEDRFVHNLAPYDWYLQFIIAGARQRKLSTSFLDYLESLPALPDADSTRSNANWLLIPPSLRGKSVKASA